MASTTQASPAVATTGQLAAMPPAQREQYLSQLDPASQQQARSALSQMRTANNAAYLMSTYRKIATCFPTNGGIQQPYTQGASLYYNFPTASGAFCTDLLVTMNVNFTPATGTGATYGYTAAGALAAITEIDILFNGVQARIRPYFLYIMELLRTRQNPYPSAAAGNVIAALTTQLSTVAPTLTGGTPAQWTLKLRIPLNALHYLSPAGVIPIQGSATKGQIVVQTAQSLFGPDPMLNAIYGTGGTGNAVTVNAGANSQVLVEAIYTDGTNPNSPTPLSLDIVGEATCQYIIDTPLSPLAATIVQRQRIATLLKHYYIVSVVIDGNASNKFTAVTNLTGIELDQDSVGQNKFFLYNSGVNNVSVYDYYWNIRTTYQQDMPEGVVIWQHAEAFGQENPDNRMGNAALNMMTGGWTDVHHAYVLTTVNGLGTVTPRVETYLLSLNPTGLIQGA
jgi:hypothetical protein